MVAIRSEREIELIARSCQIVAETLNLLGENIAIGVSLIDLDKIAEDYIVSQGARPAFKGYMGFPSTLCISIDDEVVHGIPRDVQLKEGQIVGIDCGAEKNGYYGDSARTFAVGTIDEKKAQLMKVTQESLMKGIEAAHEGNYVSDIGHAIQSHVENHGYSVVRELVGHGIGTQLHEEPQVPNYGKPKHGYKLKAGMVIAIEPMINIGSSDVRVLKDGWTVVTSDHQNSAHFEHSVLVTSKGPQILSQSLNN